MRIVTGLLFIIISFVGSVFFRSYSGSVISYPALWYILFTAFGLLGVWFIYSDTRKMKRLLEEHKNSETEKLKSNAKIIELDVDKCEFKSGSFSQQVEDHSMDAFKIFIPGSIGSIADKEITESVIQSYLIFTEIVNGETCKFISQSFPFDQTTVKFYVLNHSIKLYIDRFDKRKYLFDLQK